MQVGSPLTALAISTNILDKGVPRVVAAADVSGSLHLYDREGELSLTLPPTEETSAARVSSIVIGAREDPFIATATSGGEVSPCAPHQPSPTKMLAEPMHPQETREACQPPEHDIMTGLLRRRAGPCVQPVPSQDS